MDDQGWAALQFYGLKSGPSALVGYNGKSESASDVREAILALRIMFNQKVQGSNPVCGAKVFRYEFSRRSG